MSKISLLDCTLRDGGYYNNWDFNKDLIEKYLKAMSNSKIEYVELGFRFYKQNFFLGPCAYISESFIETLNIPSDIKLGIMINAKDLTSNNLKKREIEKYFFNFKINSKIKFLRFACNIDEIDTVVPYCNFLSKKNIKTAINVMKISQANDDEIGKITKKISKSKCDILYFADSLGNLEPKDISNKCKIIKKNWKRDIGFHAHDNMSRAMINCVTAVENGVKWIDSTVTGMGRGAGNLQTELALLQFAPFLKKNFNMSLLLKLIDKEFNPMKKKYNWGTNPYYYLAGQNKIHPTFVQNMLSNFKYEPFELLLALENLKKRGGSSYDKNLMETEKNFYNKRAFGTWSPSRLIKNKDVLIIGGGKSSSTYSEAIEKFVKKNNIFVIALNAQKSINENLINLRVCCHTLRILSDMGIYSKLKQPLVIPFNSLGIEQKKKFKKIKIFNYGLQVKKNKFHFKSKSCVAPNNLTIFYAISLANSGGAKKIFLTGIDGYVAGDIRRTEIDNTVENYNALKKKVELVSVTPTRYKINTTSVYAID